MTDGAPVSVAIADLTLDPHPPLARIRAQGPIGWVESLGGWMVVGHALALDVMRDARTFTVDDPRFTTGQVVGPSMLSTDGADHTRHRQPFLAPFTPRASRAWFAEFVSSETARLVSGFRPAGTVELRSALAAPLATACMQLALGLQEIPVQELLGWYTGIVQAVAELTAGEPIPPAGPLAYAALSEAILATIATGAGFLGEIASAAGALSMTELVSNTAVLLFGGIETTEAMVANLLLHLLADPGSADAVRQDPSLVEAAVEESLRLEPAAAVVDRYATEDVSIGGANIQRGDLVMVSLAAANRDPAIFPDPDRFDLQRPDLRRQLAFAQGPHVCIGLHVARLQARQAALAVLSLPQVRLDRDRSTLPTGLVFRKPAAVQALWTD